MIVDVAPRLSDAAFQALGDPNRRAILEELGHGERSVAQLTRRVGISQPAVSRHLRLLKSAGLVDDYPDGAKNIYRLRREGAKPSASTSKISGARPHFASDSPQITHRR